MGQGPEPGTYDKARLLASMESQLAAQRAAMATGMDSWSAHQAAYERAIQENWEHGHMASLLLHWLTGGWGDAATLDKADTVLHSVDDPRRGALLGIIERIARADITWEELARKTKKGLIPRYGWEPPPDPGPDAIPLRNAKRVLLESLAAAGVMLKRPSPGDAWRVFVHFAQQPIRAPRGFHVTDDRCLAEVWARSVSGHADRLHWSLVRQFDLSDNAGNYDHMRQLSLELAYELLDIDDVDAQQASWSEGDLVQWAWDFEELPCFTVLTEAEPISATVRLSRI